jgi:hypothetical protein
LNTWLPAGTRLQLTQLNGTAKPYTATVDKDGALSFSLPEQNSFALIKYTIIPAK